MTHTEEDKKLTAELAPHVVAQIAKLSELEGDPLTDAERKTLEAFAAGRMSYQEYLNICRQNANVTPTI